MISLIRFPLLPARLLPPVGRPPNGVQGVSLPSDSAGPIRVPAVRLPADADPSRSGETCMKSSLRSRVLGARSQPSDRRWRRPRSIPMLHRLEDRLAPAAIATLGCFIPFPNGASPHAGLVQDSSGNLFGTTQQ